MNYYTILKDEKIKGFYCKDIHGEDYCKTIINSGGLEISEELWSHLLSLGESKFIGEVEKRLYTIEDKELFEEVIQPIDTTPQPPSFNEQLVALGEELTQEKLKNIQKDSTISQLGEELANLKLEFINLKGGN